MTNSVKIYFVQDKFTLNIKITKESRKIDEIKKCKFNFEVLYKKNKLLNYNFSFDNGED